MKSTIGMIVLYLAGSMSVLGQVRVYVFTQNTTEGFVDADSQRRLDSLRDIQKHIAKRKGLALAETEADADVLLEVTQSGQVVGGTQTRRQPGILTGPYYETKPVTTPQVSTVLRIPGSTYTLDIIDHGTTWGYMAERIVNTLETWVKKNRERLKD